jgi:16S rRNA (guanine527-N7)-methyltransferase
MIELSSAQKAKLEQYVSLLLEWNQKFNLIGKSTIEDVWERHILDSLQLLKFIKKTDKVLDFGTGAGLPGVVLNICGVEDITLVESTTKKCKFLETVKIELSLNYKIRNLRIEDMEKESFDVITSRAVANLNKLFILTKKHHNQNQRFVFPKGKNFEQEIKDAQKKWKFRSNSIKSEIHKETGQTGAILEIKF